MSGAFDTATVSFEPPLGLRHAHIQSILGGGPVRDLIARRRAADLLSASQVRILDCGEARLLGHFAPQAGESRGLVILLHGWEGCADSQYMLAAGALARNRGYDVFRLNFRDHGDTHTLNEGLFHSCRLEEVARAVGAICEAYPRGRTLLIGYSLGGNFALRVAAAAPAFSLPLDRAVAICPVLNPPSTMRALETGLWVYRSYFLRRWRRSLRAKAAAFPRLYDFGDLGRFPTLTATTAFFVQRYTEFTSLDEYLNGYSLTGDRLDGLQVPSRLIAARDDPVIPSEDLAAIARPPALDVTLAPYGGHCAFLDSFRLSSWLDRQLSAELG